MHPQQKTLENFKKTPFPSCYPKKDKKKRTGGREEKGRFSPSRGLGFLFPCPVDGSSDTGNGKPCGSLPHCEKRKDTKNMPPFPPPIQNRSRRRACAHCCRHRALFGALFSPLLPPPSISCWFCWPVGKKMLPTIPARVPFIWGGGKTRPFERRAKG